MRGRSAYLCPARACFEQALRRRALERALGRVGASAHEPEPATEQPDEHGGPEVGGRSRPHRARVPALEALWPSVVAALDHELENLQRTGDIAHKGPRYDALSQLRQSLGRGLGRESAEPGRSA